MKKFKKIAVIVLSALALVAFTGCIVAPRGGPHHHAPAPHGGPGPHGGPHR